jgi:hypothetical protein
MYAILNNGTIKVDDTVSYNRDDRYTFSIGIDIKFRDVFIECIQYDDIDGGICRYKKHKLTLGKFPADLCIYYLMNENLHDPF